MNKIDVPGQEKLLIAIFFGLLVYLLYGRYLTAYWQGDDPLILVHILSFSIVDIFFDPAAWQVLSQVNLTPLLSFSYVVDYALAGMNPAFFYLHHLVVLTSVAMASYLLLALFVSRTWALAGTLLFLLGAPVASSAAQLMTRHYLEGLLLALCSLYCFFRYQRNLQTRWLTGSVLLYAIAVTAKEIYVPLVVLYAVLSCIDRRPLQSLPYVIVLAIYIVWRTYMLPGLVEGYAINTEYYSRAFWTRVVSSLLNIPQLVLGVHTLPVLALFAVLLIATVRKMPRQWLLFLFCAGLVCGPLVPLVYFPGLVVPDRYIMLPWYLFCFAAAFFTAKALEMHGSKSRIKLTSAIVAWILVCIVTPRAQEDYLQNIDDFFRVVDPQLRFLWNEDRELAFVPTPQVSNAMYLLPAMRELKFKAKAGAAMPVAIVDDKFLTEGLALLAFSAECNCLEDISDEVPARMQRLAASEQPNRALSIEFSNLDGLMSWTFGPYENGTYSVVAESMGSVPLPMSQHQWRTLIRTGFDFYLRYEAPEGWVTYSSLLHLEPDGTTVRWERN